MFTVSLPNHKNRPLAVGCYWNAHAKAEIYMAETNDWVDVPDYPYGEMIDSYATASSRYFTYVIGGRGTGYKIHDIVAAFANDNSQSSWSLAGRLNRKRSSSGAVTIGYKTMILGGDEGNYDDNHAGYKLYCIIRINKVFNQLVDDGNLGFRIKYINEC